MATPSPTQKKTFKEKLFTQKWPTLIALPILLITTFNNIYSVWGVLFVFWGFKSVFSGNVHLVETIERENNQILFWLISTMWIGFGVMYILADVYPSFWL